MKLLVFSDLHSDFRTAAKLVQLVVCGHIHGSAGQIKKLGETTVINAGPHGIFWDLKKN